MEQDDKKSLIEGQGVKQLHLSLAETAAGPQDDSEIRYNGKDDHQARKFLDSPLDSSMEGYDFTQSFTSGVESDPDDSNVSESLVIAPPAEKKYDPTIDDRLPETVTLLTTPDGAKVYLIGTAHFSEESQNDVSLIIQAVQPHIVMVELCEARVHVLQLDEKTILEEAGNLTLAKMRATIRKNGLFNGLLYVLLLNMSANLTKQLGMAPGGEFRRAFLEAKKVQRCLVHLGDRPINITIQRALSSLSWWQTIKLLWNLLRTKEPISKEDVERCKRKDFLEELLTEMGTQYPSLREVFVKERDMYLTHSLQLAALPIPTPHGLIPSRVVGIVGIGHTPGMIEHWGTIKPSDIAPIMRTPERSLSSKILRISLKVSLLGAVIYVGYKYIPLPSATTLQSLKSSVEGLLKVSANR
ncbi:traB domain-containing protein isoform X1 [Fopius arisanus]|uniref:TraB domain-containing protein isoform X1 n=1 Tax=Fopius arisanus TaxID=64838 RepID=A0A9R1TAV5_9HYME|nr:PREDICTED: traB domain-containing protein isoform X1 [Fopius arisanus]